MTQVWRMDLATTDKMVLLALADAANDDGVCWTAVKARTPGKLDLITKCSLSDRAIQGAIKRLCEAGLLGRIERPGKGVIYTVMPSNDPRRSCAPKELRPEGNDIDPRRSFGETVNNHQPISTTRARKGPEKPTGDFDDFWSRFPLKKSKLAAAKAYPKALRKLDHEALVRHLDHQICCGVWDGPYGPHAATWLNGERWNDDCQPRRFAGMAGQTAPGYRGRQDTSLAEIAERRRREREAGMEVPGGQGAVSGDDLGWADGAIEGEPSRRFGEG